MCFCAVYCGSTWRIEKVSVDPPVCLCLLPVGAVPLVGFSGVSPLGFVGWGFCSVGVRWLELLFPFSLKSLGGTSVVPGWLPVYLVASLGPAGYSA